MTPWFSKKTNQQATEATEILETLQAVRRRRKEAMEMFKRQLEAVPKVDQALEAIGNDLAGGPKDKGD